MSSREESSIDLLTYTFQATVFPTLTLGLGYLIGGSAIGRVGGTLPWLAKTLLAPCLVVSILAPADNITFGGFWKFWPIPALAIITHLISFGFALVLNRARWTKAPGWLVGGVSYNNVSSFPLYTLLAYFRLSQTQTQTSTSDSAQGEGLRGPLSHLKWRILDTDQDQLGRALVYVVLSWWVIDVARALLRPVVDRMTVVWPAVQLPVYDEDGDISDEDEEQEEEDVEAASVQSYESQANNTSAGRHVRAGGDGHQDETTPLLPSSTSSLTSRLPFLGIGFNNTFLPGVLALLIAFIPPLKNNLADPSGWVGKVIGGTLGWVGLSYIVVDVLAIGVTLRQAEVDKKDKKPLPPTLGSVLLICAWRYFALPAISIAIVYGMRKHLPIASFIHDPVFAYVLASTVISPPRLPAHLNAHLASVYLSVYALYFVSSVALAYSILIPGTGISFENNFDVKGALKSALGGGVAGAAAMVLQVLTLMWIRTTMNYQYRYGGTFVETLKKLWHEGGIKRFYAGLWAALLQAPISRFGDTAANAGIFALLSTLTWPVLVKTIAASLSSALFRMTLTPIDTLKTTQQTKGGVEGLKLLRKRVQRHGVGCLWWGAVATAGATFVGHCSPL
ncbi:hypothetical protein FFLO_05041 [Filobasidium floriforme]|uniref:Uncharacterized protein n=1 Tax=Filobasidium floriforme TaxID=5210 RepID=A0A8K0JIZ8_9TREE|nr:hypothetical protein FFLO_05041 [Filobasidium floriforme]